MSDTDIDDNGRDIERDDLAPAAEIQSNIEEYIEALEDEADVMRDCVEALNDFDADEQPDEEWLDEYADRMLPLTQWRLKEGE